jgi:hypothetical protein
VNTSTTKIGIYTKGPVSIQIAVSKISVNGSSTTTENKGPVKNFLTDSKDLILDICAEIEAPSVYAAFIYNNRSNIVLLTMLSSLTPSQTTDFIRIIRKIDSAVTAIPTPITKFLRVTVEPEPITLS